MLPLVLYTYRRTGIGMPVEHRIVPLERLSSEERGQLLESLRSEGWSPVFRHEGKQAWSRGFPDGFVIYEREVPAEDEPRWCAW